MTEEKARDFEGEIKKLEAKLKKAEKENGALIEQIEFLEAQIATLQKKQADDAKAVAALSAKAAKAEVLEKLLARDGPHDPVTKYD